MNLAMKDQELNGQIRVTVGPRTGRKYVRDPTRCSKIGGINTQCKNQPAPGSKFCQKHLDQSRQRQTRQKNQLVEASKIHGHDKTKKKRARTNIHQEKPPISKKQLMDEDHEVEDEDVDSEERRQILVGHLPWMNGFQKSKNGNLIQRKLYKTKAVCDAIYRLNLEMDQRPPPRSWIEHNKMQSFDEQKMSLKQWMGISKASTNQLIGRKKNNCDLRSFKLADC